MITIRSSANINFSDGIKACLYGKSGSGKTPILATAPSPIIINLEKGLISIRRCNPPVPFIDCIDNGSNKAPIDFLESEVIPWLASSAEARQFYTCGLDSLAEVMELDLEERNKRVKDGRQAHYQTAQRTKEIARKFRNMPGRTVVLICKEEQGTDLSTGMNLYQPMIAGKVLSAEMPYFFDEVLRAEVGHHQGKEWRAIRCKANNIAHARDRSEMLGEYEACNLTSIFSKILSV